MQRPSVFVLIVLGLSGLVPLLALTSDTPETSFFIYALFVLAFLIIRPRAVDRNAVRPGRPVLFVLAYIAVGLVVECLAWTGHYLACSPQPILFHPQLVPDLLIGFGFYSGAGIAWVVLIRRFGFSLREVFVIQGLIGVFIEQQGAAFFAGLAALPLGALFWAYVFAVYGSVPGLARLLVDPGQVRPVAVRRWWHGLLALIAVPAVTIAGIYAFGFVILAFGGLPAPGDICARPFI